jgi:hypothetical protein
MGGTEQQQSSMFSYISAERRVPKDHPLRAVRAIADAALVESESHPHLSFEFPPPGWLCPPGGARGAQPHTSALT